jgi:hypothetical protein
MLPSDDESLDVLTLSASPASATNFVALASLLAPLTLLLLLLLLI